jgi:hypothetical protein
MFRDIERFEEAIGFVVRRLDARTSVTSLNVAPNKGLHARPRVVT